MTFNMADTKMCRICLRKNVKLFHYNGFQLKLFYEEILHKIIIDEDILPRYFCFECAAMLHKFHKFRAKCNKGQELLLHIHKGKKISPQPNIELEISGNYLKSQLDLITVNERVKTITIKSRAKLKNDKKSEKVITDNVKTEEQSETETFSEDECKNKINKQKDILFDDNSNNGDEAISDFLIDDKIDGDSKMIIDTDDRALSSDDDTLSDLKNKTKLNKTKNDKTPQDVKRKVTGKNTANKKRVRGKQGEKETQEKKTKWTLDSEYWEKKQLNEKEAQEEFNKKAENPKYLEAAYQCNSCFRGFSKEDMLFRHNKKKHAESRGPVVCKFCKCRFRIQCELTRHIRQHYNLYKCLRCNLICNLEMSALLHEEHHNGVVKKCEHCGEGFTHTSTYYTHLRSHRSSFVCTLCGQSFVSDIGLRYHKTLKHTHMEELAQPEKNATEEKDTYCERCKIKFETREAYEQHYLHSAMHSVGTAVQGCEDTAVAAPLLPKARVKGGLVRRPRAPTDCPHCNTTFRTKRAFLKHPCVAQKECAERGTRARGRGRGRGRGWVQMNPQRKSQQNSKKEMCEICGATVGAMYIRAHINTHTHQKVYSCDICGVKMYSQSSHQRHQLTHTGERPYPCPLCDKRFTQSNSMKLHYRTFHLKEPYPKRNRKPKDDVSLTELSSLQTWSTDS